MGTYVHTQEDIDKVSNAIRSNMLSAGPELNEFEQKVASYHNKRHGIMVNSGQTALEVALALAKYKLGKDKLKVLIPATTYAATLWAVLNTGNEPVFCDIHPKSYTVDWDNRKTLKAIEKCDVLMPVDLWGYSADPYEVQAFYPSTLKNKFIIQDACEAFGNKSACYGDIICHSFYVSHIITTGSGGMLSLDDEELAEYARSYISHGRTLGGDFTKFKDKWEDRFLFDKIGTSYRSNNLDAALGLSRFSKLRDIITQRRQNAATLSIGAENSKLNEYFAFVPKGYIGDSVFQFYPILIKNHNGTVIEREHLLQYLYEHGIDSRVLLSLTNQPIVKHLYGDIEHKYPIAEFCNKNGFIIGCHQDLNKEDMEYILTILGNYIPKVK